MSRKRKVWVGLGLAALVLVVAVSAIASSGGAGAQVRTEQVARRDLVSVVTASGIIQPKRKVDISADISGRVIALAVEEGQTVQAGDLLLRIDPTSSEAAVRRAEAMVAQARANAAQARASVLQAESAARRAEQLASGDRLISEQELEQAVTQEQVAHAQQEAARYAVAQAQASLSEAREALRKTTIVAPMSGRVTRLNIEQGETAIVGTMNNPGSLLLTVADLSVMEASVRVDETDVPHIEHGDSAVVSIDALPGRKFSGRVTQVSNSAIIQTGAAQPAAGQSVDYEVVITLDSPPPGLRPDLSATAEIITATRKRVLSVPIISVTVRDPDGHRFSAGTNPAEERGPAEEEIEVEGVFVVEDGVARFRPVTVGIAGERYFELEDGLEGGEIVIAGPYSAIRELEDGDEVRVSRPPASAAPAAGGTPEAGGTASPAEEG
jgi:HlyD family secretion protein